MNPLAPEPVHAPHSTGRARWMVTGAVLVAAGIGVGYGLRGCDGSTAKPIDASPFEAEAQTGPDVRAPQGSAVAVGPGGPAKDARIGFIPSQGKPAAGSSDAADAALAEATSTAVDAGAVQAAASPANDPGALKDVYDIRDWTRFIWLPPPELRTASIQGTVLFAGVPPTLPPIQRGAAFGCPDTPVPDPSLIVTDGKLANAVVQVLVSLDDASSARRPDLTVQQKDCMYEPHVALQAGHVLNADQTFHRLEAYADAKLVLDAPLYPGTPAVRLPWGHRLWSLKCGIHPWMQGYVFETTSPFATVTDSTGTFAFSGLPRDRTYTVVAWHERYGMQRLQAPVGKGASSVAFTFGAAAQAGK